MLLHVKCFTWHGDQRCRSKCFTCPGDLRCRNKCFTCPGDHCCRNLDSLMSIPAPSKV